MRKAELLRRIEELERRLAIAEARLAAAPVVQGPAIGPVFPVQPVQPFPMPGAPGVWPPGTVIATAEVPLCPYPIGSDRAVAGYGVSFIAAARVEPGMCAGAGALGIGAASAQGH